MTSGALASLRIVWAAGSRPHPQASLLALQPPLGSGRVGCGGR